MALLAHLQVLFSADATGLKQAFSDVQKQTAGFQDKMRGLSNQLGGLGKTLTGNVTAPIVALGAISVREFGKQAEAVAKLESVLKSTGGAAGSSSAELIRYAESLQKVTTFGDDVIIDAQAMLGTFTQVRNEVGTGNDVFNQATKSVLDMSAVLGQDLRSSVIQVGKALNDPIRGVTALRRVGVQLTEQQEEQIKAFMAAGDVMSAQKVILGELQTQFGGAAEAMAKTPTGELKQGLNALGDAAEDVGAALTPVLKQVAAQMSALAGWFKSLSPETKTWVVNVALAAAALGPLLKVLSDVVTVIRVLVPVLGGLGKALLFLAANPVGAVVAAIGLLIAGGIALYQNWDEVKEFLKGIWDGIKTAFDAVVTWFVDTIADWTGLSRDEILGVWEAIKRGVTLVWEGIKRVAETIWNAIVGVIKFELEVAKAVFSAVWNGIRATVEFVWDVIETSVKAALHAIVAVIRFQLDTAKAIVKAAFALIRKFIVEPVQAVWEVVRTMFQRIVDWIGDKLEAAKRIVKNVTDSVTGFFKNMFKAVVGGSFVPDMVLGVVRWFTVMRDTVLPLARETTEGVASEFKGLADEVDAKAETMLDMLKRFADDAKSALSDLFVRIFEGQLNTLGDLWKSALSSIKRIIADFLASQVVRQFLGFLAEAFGLGVKPKAKAPAAEGGGGGGFQGRFGLEFAGGGRVPGPLGAPQLAVVHGGETVFTPEQIRALSGAGSVNVQVINNTGIPVNAQVSQRSVKRGVKEVLIELFAEDGDVRSMMRGGR